MRQIEALTPEQEALLPVYRDKWLEIGLSTEPSNKILAEQAAIDAYKVVGLPPPGRFAWSDSPLSLLREVLQESSISNPAWTSVSSSAWASVGDSVDNFVSYSVRASITASISIPVCTSVSDSVWTPIIDSVWTPVMDSAWNSFISPIAFGQHDAYWLGFYDFLLSACHLSAVQKLEPLINLAKDCGWWISCEDVCYMSEKPTVCQVESGVLHSEDRPVIVYRDGFQIWASELPRPQTGLP